MNGARATEKQRECVRRLHAKQVSVPAIMERTGLTRRQVDYICRDLPRHPPKWDRAEVQAQIDALTKRLKQPPSLSQLGEHLGLSKQATHAMLVRAGITKAPSPHGSLSFAERLKRQTIAAGKARHRRAMLVRKTARDAKIIALHKAKLTREQIATRVGCHVNTVRKVLQASGVV